LKKLAKAEYDYEVDWALINTADYITKMYTVPLRPKWQDIYDAIKKRKQNEKAKRDAENALDVKRDQILIQRGVTAYREGNTDIRSWLMKQGMPKKAATAYEKEIIARVFRDKLIGEGE
jgi:hypothetical protein